MPTTLIAGREYNVIEHHRRRPVPVMTKPTEEEIAAGVKPTAVTYRKRHGSKGDVVERIKTESKLVFAGYQLERVEKKDRKVSGRQRRKARKAEKRGKA